MKKEINAVGIGFLLVFSMLIISCKKDKVEPSSEIKELNEAPCQLIYNHYGYDSVVNNINYPMTYNLVSMFYSSNPSFGFSNYQIGLYDTVTPNFYTIIGFQNEPTTGLYILKDSISSQGINDATVFIDSGGLTYRSITNGDSVYVESNDTVMIISFCDAHFIRLWSMDTLTIDRSFLIRK